MAKGRSLIIVGVAVAVLLLGSFVIRDFLGSERRSRGFPIPSVGAYVGTISISSDGPPSTLYLERLREGDTLLVILFSEGFQPQTLFPERLVRVEGGELYRPLVVRTERTALRLTGVSEKEGFQGIVRGEKGESGEWSLRKLDPGELKKIESNSQELAAWIRARERARLARAHLRDTVEQRSHSEARLKLLEDSLKDERDLRARALARKAQLEATLNEKKIERERLTKKVENLAGELDLLSRITKRGQAVSLTRRILQRENRWYEVNWQTDEEIGQEEIPAEEAGIDIAKFEQAVKRARETKALIRERDEELKRIRELETMEHEPSEEPEPVAPPEEKRENLWDRLFG